MKLDPDLAEGSEDSDGEDEDENGGLEAGRVIVSSLRVGKKLECLLVC